MNQSTSIMVTCPNGHPLRAPERAIGRSLPCPVCHESVLVQGPKPSLSDTSVMRILGDAAVSDSLPNSAVPAASPRDVLSDTGVMRILGDFVATSAPIQPPELPTLRTCPACSFGVGDAVSVCSNCHCYVGISPDYLRTIATPGR